MPDKSELTQELDFEQIKQIIPQRFPFLMLDRVIQAEPGIRLVGIKNLTGNEWFYQGHFPARAVTPGAMLCEAVAQAGIVFFKQAQPAMGKEVVYLIGSIKMRFLEPALPGDQLEIEITPIKLTANAGVLAGQIRVKHKTIARGEFALSAKARTGA